MLRIPLVYSSAAAIIAYIANLSELVGEGRLIRNLFFFTLATALALAILWAVPKPDDPGGLRKAARAAQRGSSLINEAIVSEAEEVTLAKRAPQEEPVVWTEQVTVRPGSNVYTTLQKAGLSSQSVASIIKAAKPYKNLARIPAKTQVDLQWLDAKDELPRRLTFRLSSTKALVLQQDQSKTWDASLQATKVETKIATYAGQVRYSLWQSAIDVGMDPYLIGRIAEIFAWQVDFSRGVQNNDRWRIVVEQHLAGDQPIGWGDVIVAEYQNVGVPITAIRYKRDGLRREYFMPDGNSMRRLFLKSPLRFGRITSRFSRKRYHPILKVNRPHLGVDYGAPRGTPVMAVGNGVVEYAMRRGGSGKTVKLRHNSVHSTAYKHLSRFAQGIKKGTAVQMGQVIGYVGSSGLATGPHLHFEFFKHGKFVDPLGIKFPSADPIPKELHEDFQKSAAKALGMLPPWPELDVKDEAVRVARRVFPLEDSEEDPAQLMHE